MNNIIIGPIILPFLTAVFLLLWRKPSLLRRVFTVISILAIFGISLLIAFLTWDNGLLLLKLGGWSPPFGIALTVDLLGAIMLSLSGFIGLCAILYGFAETPSQYENPLRMPLLFLLLAGINMSFSTGDLFNLYVSFEVMLIASYALMTLEADNWDIRHTFPYIIINLFGSAIFLIAAGLTYSLLGTLNYADIALRAANYIHDPRLMIIALMFCIVAGIKSAMFPLYYWLPRSYPVLPSPLGAFYGGMLTKVGVYVFIRLFTTVFPHDLIPPHLLVMILSAPTIFFGVIGAMSKGYVRAILSYHIISQVGYMLLAFSFFTPLGIAASIYYIVHHIIVKSSLFMIGGIGKVINHTDELDKMGNLWKTVPIVGVLFLFQALSLAGIPPLSGFWGKYLIVIVGLRQKAYFFVAISIIASILTLVSMLKIWHTAFWSSPKDVIVDMKDKRWKRMTMVVGLMTAVSLSIGLGAEFFMRVAQRAAEMALDQKAYIEAVLY